MDEREGEVRERERKRMGEVAVERKKVEWIEEGLEGVGKDRNGRGGKGRGETWIHREVGSTRSWRN